MTDPIDAPLQREPLREALLMAAGRFEDLATIIERGGTYTNAGFFRKSAERCRAVLAATPARDPVALLLAEAGRLAKSKDLEDQRRARGLQDAAKLLGGGE